MGLGSGSLFSGGPGGGSTAGTAADILWIAQVVDQTSQFFMDRAVHVAQMQQSTVTAMSAIDTSLAQTGRKAVEADKFFREWASHMALGQQRSIEILGTMDESLDDIAVTAMDTGSTTSAAMGAVVGAVGAVTNAMIRMGKEAIGAFVTMAKQSAELAAHVNTLGVMLNIVGQNAGYSRQELAEYEKQIVALGVTTRVARQMLAEMVQQNLDLTKSTDLARVGLDISRIMMIDTSDAIQRLVHGVSTLNPLVLRHLRLIVDFEQAYRNAANQMDRNWETFSIAEKQNIAINETLRLGENIAGTYAGTLDTVGGRVLDLARVTEQLQLEFGQLFQPAYAVVIRELTGASEDARKALTDMEEPLARIGVRMEGYVELVGLLLKVLGSITEALLKMAEFIGGPHSPLAQLRALFEPMEELTKMEAAANKAFVLTGARILTVVYAVTEGIGVLISIAELGIASLAEIAAHPIRALRGEITAGLTAQIQEVRGELLKFMGELPQFYLKTADALSKLGTGTSLAAKDVEEAGDVIIDTMALIAAETMAAIEKIEALNKEFAKAFTERAVEMARRELDEQIRLFRRLEDMQRTHMHRSEDIRRNHARKRADLLKDQTEDEQELAEDAADRRADLEEDYAEEQAEIWREYYRELEDIQRHYLEDVEEAARQNDAVAVARLMRKRATDRRDAAIERDRDLEDAERDYKKELDELTDFLAKRRKKLQDDAKDRLKDLDETLAEQLEDAARARQRELDELDIYQNRRMADIALADKRELEDLQRKHADQLQELGDYLGQLKYLNDSAIEYLLGKFGQYYKDDIILREAWYAARRTLDMENMYDPSGYGWGTPSPTAAPGEPGYYEPDPYGPEPYGGGYTPTPAPPQVPITQPWQDPTAIGKVPGSPYDPPSNIAQYCRLHPNDPVCAWYGLAQGGMFLASEPTPFIAGEAGQPEIVASVPLGRSMNYNINLSGGINVSGVSPGMERDIGGELMSVLKQFGEALLAGA